MLFQCLPSEMILLYNLGPKCIIYNNKMDLNYTTYVYYYVYSLNVLIIYHWHKKNPKERTHFSRKWMMNRRNNLPPVKWWDQQKCTPCLCERAPCLMLTVQWPSSLFLTLTLSVVTTLTSSLFLTLTSSVVTTLINFITISNIYIISSQNRFQL